MPHGHRALRACLAALLLSPALLAQDLKRVTIGVVADGPWVEASPFRVYEDRIFELVRGEFDVRFPASLKMSADWTPETVRTAADQLLDNDEVDYILALGVLASNDLARRPTLSKPVIAPFVLDPLLQGIPYENGVSGRPNLTYLTMPHSLRRDLETFREIAPFGRMALLISQRVYAAVPGIDDVIKSETAGMDLIIDRVLVGQTASGTLANIPPEAEAVYIGPLLNMSPEEVDLLIAGLTERKLPSFSIGGTDLVERGVLASLWPQLDLTQLAQLVAIDVQRVLLGEQLADIPVTIPVDPQLTINMKTSRTIEVLPPFTVLPEAQLLKDERGPDRREVSLSSVLRNAKEANTGLVAKARSLDAGKERVREAKSELYPQLYADLRREFIDSSRPRAGFVRAERTLAGSIEFSQMLYSDRVLRDYEVEGYRQTARGADYDALTLEVVLDAGLTYLRLLTFKSIEALEIENLGRNREYLGRAKTRVSIGVASAAETFRWESEIARARSAVLEVQSQRSQAEVTLNRLLHQSQEEGFITAESDIDDPQLGTSDPRLLTFTNDPWLFRVFRDFMVEEGLDASPELKSIDAGLAAQTRVVLGSERSFYVPDVYLRAGLDHAFDTSGTGASTTLIDDTIWDITVNARMPIYLGGSRFATRERARHELIQLRTEREALAERIEERIRLRLHRVSSSQPDIELSSRAARAARQNLDMVASAYTRGVVSIIELIDAQAAALSADKRSATAKFRFLADMLEVQQAVGRFDHFMSPADREEWFGRLQAFYEQSTMVPTDEVLEPVEGADLQTP